MFPSTFKVEENKVPLFFHFKAKLPRYGHFLDFTSTEAFVNPSGENVGKGCKFELIPLNIFKSTHLLPPDQIYTSQGVNEGMASQNVTPALKDSSPLVVFLITLHYLMIISL